MLNQDAKEIIIAGTGVIEAVADGIQWSDISALFDLPVALSGWKIGVENIREEWETESGRAEIIEFFSTEFDLPNDKAEEKVEAVVKWLDATYTALQILRK